MAVLKEILFSWQYSLFPYFVVVVAVVAVVAAVVAVVAAVVAVVVAAVVDSLFLLVKLIEYSSVFCLWNTV